MADSWIRWLSVMSAATGGELKGVSLGHLPQPIRRTKMAEIGRDAEVLGKRIRGRLEKRAHCDRGAQNRK
jgi:hypothetical protein